MRITVRVRLYFSHSDTVGERDADDASRTANGAEKVTVLELARVSHDRSSPLSSMYRKRIASSDPRLALKVRATPAMVTI